MNKSNPLGNQPEFGDKVYEGNPHDNSGLDLYVSVYEDYEKREYDCYQSESVEYDTHATWAEVVKYSGIEKRYSIQVGKLRFFYENRYMLWHRPETRMLYWAQKPQKPGDIVVSLAEEILQEASINPYDVGNKVAETDHVYARIILPYPDDLDTFIKYRNYKQKRIRKP